jgi:hypothetical protein
VQRIIGRVININPTEEPKLQEGNIGLLNIDEDNENKVFKVRLNMSEVASYSVFEGEIIVAEGVYELNGTKFNVSRIFKPDLTSKLPFTDLKNAISMVEMKSITMEKYQGKPLSAMIACGPFSIKNSLSYQGL